MVVAEAAAARDCEAWAETAAETAASSVVVRWPAAVIAAKREAIT